MWWEEEERMGGGGGGGKWLEFLCYKDLLLVFIRRLVTKTQITSTGQRDTCDSWNVFPERCGKENDLRGTWFYNIFFNILMFWLLIISTLETSSVNQ